MLSQFKSEVVMSEEPTINNKFEHNGNSSSTKNDLTRKAAAMQVNIVTICLNLFSLIINA